MADYITAAEFKTRHNITVTTDDAIIAEIVTEASRLVDSICGRRFDDSGAATARVFHPLNAYECLIDDCSSITTVKTDTGDDGNYAKTWTSGDFEAYPLNGVGPNQLTGWPYTRIVAIEALLFPTGHRRASVQVTAQWGWAAVPDEVKGATYFVANRLYEERKAPFGVAGANEFGPLPLRDQRTVDKMLAQFKRTKPMVG